MRGWVRGSILMAVCAVGGSVAGCDRATVSGDEELRKAMRVYRMAIDECRVIRHDVRVRINGEKKPCTWTQGFIPGASIIDVDCSR